MLAAGQPSGTANPIPAATNSVASQSNSPAQQALEQVMTDDDAAMDEVDQWIRDNNTLAAKGGGESRAVLNARINARLDGVRQKYEDFLSRYPNYAPGHLAYGSFLDDLGKEDLAAVQYQTASKLDPNDPAAWNDLANYYGEYSPVTNAFTDYQKAIDLDPTEPVYYENLATTVYVFRRDAMSYYGITEPQVFDKALALYRKALQLDPNDFELASDYAETYYGIRPLRTNDALVAWTNALGAAHNDVEREGVYIHLARIKFLAGRYDEARAQLASVTNAMYDTLKDRIERNIVAKEHPQTNAIPDHLQNTNAAAIPTAQTSRLPSSSNGLAAHGIPALTHSPAGTNSAAIAPTNLLNNLEVSPPSPRPMPGQE